MAETLGSLIDKLTIKSIRELYMKKMLKQKRPKFPKSKIREKLKTLERR